MAPRLLTFLNLIETALANNGASEVSAPPMRTVSFHKGIARMAFADGSGSILLQNFTLADGQICVRAVFSWAGRTETGSRSIYPRESFDWLGAAYQIAEAWEAGRNAAPADPAALPTAGAEADHGVENIAATG